MNFIQTSILEYCASAHNDKELIELIEQLIHDKGDAVYPAIFSTLTSLKLNSEEAKKHWSNVLIHQRTLSDILEREICLVPAMSDYLCSKIRALKNAKIIDSNAFIKIVKESTHDNLTGLFNRAYFFETIEQHISSANRHNTDLSVLFLDIDDFKEVNDSFGHQAGDIILCAVAETIREETRDSDIAARYGGEEFVILMPHTDSIRALVLGERIREKISEKPYYIDGRPYHLTVSGGIASYPVHAQTAKDLLDLADSALYRVKGAGKNNIFLFKEDKRRFLRIKLNRQVKIKELGFTNSESFSATSKNICIGGVLFENSEPLPIGVKIQVSVPITDKDPVLLIGTVVRIEVYGQNCYEIGMTISFKEMERTAKDEISKFLLKQSKNSGSKR
jgi:diguanylate cyclase (GGDEF)-like protein